MVGADGIEPPSAGRRPAVMTTLLSARGAPRGIKPRCAGLGNPPPSQRRGRMVGVEGLAPPPACSQSKPSAADLHSAETGALYGNRTRLSAVTGQRLRHMAHSADASAARGPMPMWRLSAQWWATMDSNHDLATK